MPTPFPGMDPYLERPDIWPDVHNRLIVLLAEELSAHLRPRYYVAIEERTYIASQSESTFAGRADIAVVGATRDDSTQFSLDAETATGVVTVEVPFPDEVRELYLEVRSAGQDHVITVLEILSPSNKRPGTGRRTYEHKRLSLFGTFTHLVEIDLLRMGDPMPMERYHQHSDYRILVSRAEHRPRADLYPFSVRQPIPEVPLPLQRGDEEPVIALNSVLHALYDRAGYDLRINYAAAPEPPLAASDAAWAADLLHEAGLRTE